jgi:hypothetical protein
MQESCLHIVPQLPQFRGSVIRLVITPLQGTGCSEELWVGELLLKSEVKKVPMVEKNPPSGAGVGVFEVMSVTGPSAGRKETSGRGLSEGGRDVITTGFPSAEGSVVAVTTQGSV